MCTHANECNATIRYQEPKVWLRARGVPLVVLHKWNWAKTQWGNRLEMLSWPQMFHPYCTLVHMGKIVYTASPVDWCGTLSTLSTNGYHFFGCRGIRESDIHWFLTYLEPCTRTGLSSRGGPYNAPYQGRWRVNVYVPLESWIYLHISMFNVYY